MKCMKKCMKTWNKMQKEGHNGLTGLERGKPCKSSGGKRQKICWWALSNSEREKSLKNFLKSKFEQVKLWFLKNLIHDFRLIENQFRLIETDKGFFKNFKTILIDRKADWINRSRQRLTKFLERKKKTQFLKRTKTQCRNTSKHWNWRAKMHEYVI